MAEGEDIQFRLVRFGISVLNLCDRLPSTTEYYGVSTRLVRSATSAAANYAVARGVEGRHDFIHSLPIVLKELNESEVWLEILNRRAALPEEELVPVQEECKVLCRIITAKRDTASET